MSQDPEQQIPQGEPVSIDPTGSPEQPIPQAQSKPITPAEPQVLPFDIDEFLADHPRSRFWFRSRQTGPDVVSNDESTKDGLFRILAAVFRPTFGRVVMLAALALVVLGVVRIGAWTSQASYIGSGRCYQVELWLHDVNSDLSWIQWAIQDAEQEVTNEAEAEEANNRIWQMFVDMHASISRNPYPEEVTELRTLWLQYLDLGFEGREANQQGDTARLERLYQEQDDVLAQRLEEEQRILRRCGLANTSSGYHLIASANNLWDTTALYADFGRNI